MGDAGLVLALFLWTVTLAPQELEPRALLGIPGQDKFAVLSIAYAAGDLPFDPSLPVEDGSANINNVGDTRTSGRCFWTSVTCYR